MWDAIFILYVDDFNYGDLPPSNAIEKLIMLKYNIHVLYVHSTCAIEIYSHIMCNLNFELHEI